MLQVGSPIQEMAYILEPKGDKTEAKKGLSGYNDFWIVKTDSLGVKIWDKTFGGQYSDFSRTIIQT